MQNHSQIKHVSVTYALSKDPDQPVHQRSLVGSELLLSARSLVYPNAKRRLFLDFADTGLLTISLDTYVIRYVFLLKGSHVYFTVQWSGLRPDTVLFTVIVLLYVSLCMRRFICTLVSLTKKNVPLHL